MNGGIFLEIIFLKRLKCLIDKIWLWILGFFWLEGYFFLIVFVMIYKKNLLVVF